jgi:hypothetical protein
MVVGYNDETGEFGNATVRYWNLPNEAPARELLGNSWNYSTAFLSQSIWARKPGGLPIVLPLDLIYQMPEGD